MLTGLWAILLVLVVERLILLQIFLSVDVLACAGDEVIFKLDLIFSCLPHIQIRVSVVELLGVVVERVGL